MTNIHTDYPLVELHRHLDGSVRLETILDIGLKHNLPLPEKTLEGLRPYVQITEVKPTILDFFKKFEWLTAVMIDYEACRRIAYENVEDAKNEGIDYIELRFSPWFMAEKYKLNPAGVVEAVVDGVQAGSADFGVKTNLIGIISRTYGTETCMKELDALLTKKEAIIALDLAGDESNFPGEWFVDHFNKAHDAGWHATVHAGEVLGPEAVWFAVKELGAERLGHAVTSVQDLELLDYLAEKGIGIESCLTSNLQTSSIARYADHPIKVFLERGVAASLNTDDPGISAITIGYEYDHAAVEVGLSPEDIFQTQKNGLDTAFLSAEDKAALGNG